MLSPHQSRVAGFIREPLDDALPNLHIYATQAVVTVAVVRICPERRVILLDGAAVLLQAD